MNFTAFQKQVAKQMQERLAESVRVETSQVTKNNGVVWNGIRVFREGVNAAPMIYLDELYREYCDGRTMHSIVGQVIRVYEKSRLEGSIQMDFFLDYEQVRGKIVYRLVNYHRNEELLKTMPHIRFLDLAVIFVCLVMNDSMSGASILINSKHCSMWQVDADELFRAASENTPRYQRICVKSMEEVIQDMFEEKLQVETQRFLNDKYSDYSREQAGRWADEMRAQLERELAVGRESGAFMYVMGNRNKQYGAGTILYPEALAEAAERLGQNLFILPCSVHEVILIPDTGRETAWQLQQMVREVNATQLEAEDILSDSVYYFDRTIGEVTLVCEG